MLFRINAIISYKKGGWSTYAATLDSSGHKKYAGGGGPTKEDLREEKELFSWPRFIETFPDIALPTAINVSHISDIKFSVGIDGDSTFLVTESTGVVDDADIKLNLVKFAYYTRQVYDPAKVTNTAGSSSVNPNAAYNSTYGNFAGYIEAGPPAGVAEAAWSNTKSVLFGADGADECLVGSTTFPTSPAAGAYSVSLWAKSSNPGGSGARVLFHMGGIDDYEWLQMRCMIYEDGTQLKVYVGAGNPGSSLQFIGQPALSAETSAVWYHIVYTDTGEVDTAGNIYINAAQDGPFGEGIDEEGIVWLGTTVGTRVTLIGAAPHDSGLGGQSMFYEGNIDEVAIYDKVLSSEEVTTLYHGGGPAIDATTISGCVHYWRMGDADGDGTDSVGSGSNTIHDVVGSPPVNMTGQATEAADVEEDVPS